MKKSQPDDDNPDFYVPPTFYPIKNELDRLADEMKFEILEKRIRDMTVENVIKDVMVKREEIKKKMKIF